MIDALTHAADYIENHLNHPITVLEVAEKTGYSQFYFSRLFSEVTRMSLYNYIIRRKVSYAYDLLLNDTLKIVDVALECGFNSHEAFIRAFRRHFDTTPSEVRIQNINKPLLKQEALTRDYIEFLIHLSVKRPASDLLSGYFFGEPVCEMTSAGCYLTVLDSEKLIHKRYTMQGVLTSSHPIIAYPLTYKAVATFESNKLHFCERFLFEQIENWETPITYYLLTDIQLHNITFYSHAPINSFQLKT